MSARLNYRSAGACPPRALALRKNRSGPVARGPVPRDLPRTQWHGEGQALALRDV